MRIGIEPSLRVRDADLLQEIKRALADLLLAEVEMVAENIADLLANRL